MRVSVAIPLHNEESVLPELLRRVTGVLDSLAGGPHEIVFVDDGSRDRTLSMLEEAAARDRRISVISLSRNFGHQAAVTAALDHTRGDVVIVMDGDLQDSPEAIPELIAKHQEGYDVVYVRRVQRKESWLLRASFGGFYRLLASMSEVQLPLDAGDFGLVSARVVDQLRAMREHHRYIRGLRAWAGFRQTGISIERLARAAGEPKYGLRSYLRLASDGIFAFSFIPIRAAAIVGAMAVGLCVLFAIYSVLMRLFFGHVVAGFTALLLVITFLAGVNLAFLGIIGEYVGRVYDEVKGRPLYIVERLIREGSVVR